MRVEGLGSAQKLLMIRFPHTIVAEIFALSQTAT